MARSWKRRLAIEVFKVNQGLNSRLIPFFTFVESKSEGLLFEVKRKNRVRKKYLYIPGFCGKEFT